MNYQAMYILDTIRKMLTKLLTNCLSDILSLHQVLKGLNFCGLKGEDTTIPLHVINDVIEHAKEKQLELWIATQDMQKAYDSVSLTSLQLSLERLDMPENLINWIIDLFRDRHIKA